MKSLLTLLCIFTFSQNAHAKFSLVGGIDYNMNKSAAGASIGSVSATAEVKGGMGVAFGLLSSVGSFETGAIFVNKSYTSTVSTSLTGPVETSTTSSCVHVPILYRMGGGKITFGLGGFVDFASSTNYGLSAGPRIGGSNGGFFLDTRFNYGLKSGNTTDILALFGYAFGGK